MKNKLFNILAAAIMLLYACKKDLGNYNYNVPTVPKITGLADSTVNAFVGDSLIIKPEISLEGGDAIKDLTFNWEIIVAEEARTVQYTGYPLRIVYNLKPMTRTAKLTVTDNRNGMKYFYKFFIKGGTQFSVGQTVLSIDNGITKLSFIRPDSSVIPNLYYALHNEDLPANPVQLFAKPLAYQQGSVEDYWVICKDPAKPSVILDGSTMLRKIYFDKQFFKTPDPLVTEKCDGAMGIPTGIFNGKLYISVTTTAPFAPDFGKFSSVVAGNYQLSSYYTRTPSYYFAFDKLSHGFVTFNGGGGYMGSDYNVTAAEIFNPKNLGTGELLFMQAVPSTSYAFYKSTDGNIYEYTFIIDMNNYDLRTIKPVKQRIFKGASLIQADTRWEKSTVDIFYFTANDKIYRYNPVNEDLRQLDADFGGKKVSMIKLNDTNTALLAGIEGSVVTLDVSVGKNGNIVSKINGIPGSPIDIVTRK
ncbi:hypothetical protein DVR12_19090 [Chitinophaga silvatica]|uniref:PKD-like family protein n=1 Tax=Chitinophaga silvatica TaxID=2282649 RepID=A0A3E1Y6U1_9BACT|nr:PKD-like family lipoprotein [Chitinophaga silvatica]RFS20666.1 hypothetical protein DVR12_19090 [Chitinophaga silvatica]